MKNFAIPSEFKHENIILHFDAVDAISVIYLNGKLLGENVGGYLPFEFNITHLLTKGENTLTVQVKDETNPLYPYGKQRIQRGGMWYTPISGIWQSVWLEGCAKNYVKELKIAPALNEATINTVGGEDKKHISIKDVGEFDYTGDSITVSIPNPINWTPENPHLYYFELTSGEDKISSYFALRTVSVQNLRNYPVTLLNGKPYFFNGILDQGYFSDGIYLPSTPDGYKNDILKMKELGFNMLRKHIKIEPDLFYYYCDLYGMAVFQDMVNSGKYSFFVDTALPTIGFKKGFLHRANKEQKSLFEGTAKNIVKHLYNHPSVVQYTIFNEGWGQYDRGNIYDKLKKLDPTRLYDTASGWFKPLKSDFESEHIYFKPIKLKSNGEKPLFLSEFGGYSYKIDAHSFNLDKTYGYRMFKDKSAFVKAMQDLYLKEISPAVKQGLTATVLTQVSDVEDETNGILTYDRQVQKLYPNDIKPIFDEIQKQFNALHNSFE